MANDDRITLFGHLEEIRRKQSKTVSHTNLNVVKGILSIFLPHDYAPATKYVFTFDDKFKFCIRLALTVITDEGVGIAERDCWLGVEIAHDTNETLSDVTPLNSDSLKLMLLPIFQSQASKGQRLR